MKNSIKKLLRSKLNENEIAIVGDVPSLTYIVKIKGRSAGKVSIKQSVPELGENTAEIVGLEMNNGYNDLDSSIKAVKHIWTVLPELQRMVVSVTPENQILWEKIGFQRLNDTFWIASRGH